jgi:K+-transporting ATPase A subunit
MTDKKFFFLYKIILMYIPARQNSCMPFYSCNKETYYENPYQFTNYDDMKYNNIRIEEKTTSFPFLHILKKNKNAVFILIIVAIVAYIYNDYKRKFKNLEVKIIKKKN